MPSVDSSFLCEAVGDYTGYLISRAGDVNEDGFDDILIGASRYFTGNGTSTSQMYLIEKTTVLCVDDDDVETLNPDDDQ